MGTAVGVDLGTSNSMVAWYGRPGQPIAAPAVPDAIPSVVAYLDGGSVVVGSRALRRGTSDPAATIGSAKRFLGRGYPAVAETVGAVAYDVVPSASESVRFDVRGEPIAPEEVSACVLRRLADELARRLGEPVTEAVITVPALFGDAQRRATREAARLAGLDVMRIMNESTAAALAYGFDRGGQETVMVFDLGGGSLDVGIVDVGFGIVEVRAVAGDAELGGDDFDRAIADHLADEVAAGTGTDPRDEPRTWHRLLAAAERAKVRLSSAVKTRVSVPVNAAGRSGRVGLTLSRDAFEDLTADLVERCRRTTERALADAGVTPDDLDEAIIVGRAARMPAVRAMLGSFTRGRPGGRGRRDRVRRPRRRHSGRRPARRGVRRARVGRHPGRAASADAGRPHVDHRPPEHGHARHPHRRRGRIRSRGRRGRGGGARRRSDPDDRAGAVGRRPHQDRANSASCSTWTSTES